MHTNNIEIKATKQYSLTNLFSEILKHALVILVCISCILPMILVLSASLSDDGIIKKYGYSVIPRKLSFSAYEFAFSAQSSQILQSYIITIFVTVVGTAIGIWLTTSLAYVLTRKDFTLSRHISFFVFFTMLFNGGLIPSYILMVNFLHLKNSIAALIVPLLVNAWNVLLMKGFLGDIPTAVIESAKIDGAREFTIFTKIIIPMGKTGIVTVSLFIALSYWNDWFSSLLYIDNNKIVSLQFLLQSIINRAEFLKSGEVAKYMKIDPSKIPTISTRMAMCVIAAGPMLVVFPLFQRYFVKGIVVGSVKG